MLKTPIYREGDREVDRVERALVGVLFPEGCRTARVRADIGSASLGAVDGDRDILDLPDTLREVVGDGVEYLVAKSANQCTLRVFN